MFYDCNLYLWLPNNTCLWYQHIIIMVPKQPAVSRMCDFEYPKAAGKQFHSLVIVIAVAGSERSAMATTPSQFTLYTQGPSAKPVACQERIWIAPPPPRPFAALLQADDINYHHSEIYCLTNQRQASAKLLERGISTPTPTPIATPPPTRTHSSHSNRVIHTVICTRATC